MTAAGKAMKLSRKIAKEFPELDTGFYRGSASFSYKDEFDSSPFPTETVFNILGFAQAIGPSTLEVGHSGGPDRSTGKLFYRVRFL